MIQGVRHIIFDLGGVILNLDYSATIKAFKELGIEDIEARFSQLNQSSFFDDWETGRIDRDAFINGLREASVNPKVTDEQLCNAWNAMMLDFPLRRLQILQQLRNQFDLFLLSNTNEIHEAGFNEILRRDHGLNSLGHFFDRVYYSHRVGMRKPDQEIFRFVLEQNGLKAEHTLFIDDNAQNIAAANGLGIQTILLENGMTMEVDIFRPKTVV
jgi:putative hydrolase of the HAD superfamily